MYKVKKKEKGKKDIDIFIIFFLKKKLKKKDTQWICLVSNVEKKILLNLMLTAIKCIHVRYTRFAWLQISDNKSLLLFFLTITVPFLTSFT